MKNLSFLATIFFLFLTNFIFAQCSITVNQQNSNFKLCNSFNNMYANVNATCSQGGANNLAYQWQYNNGSGWLDIPSYNAFYGGFVYNTSSNSIFLDAMPASSVGLQLRAKIIDGVCGAIDTSVVFTITQGIPTPLQTFYDTITFGDTIFRCSQALYLSGSYFCNYKNESGCDSNITHKLYVIGQPNCIPQIQNSYGLNFSKCENGYISTNVNAQLLYDDGSGYIYYQWQIFNNNAWQNLDYSFTGGNVYSANTPYMSIYNLNNNANNIPIRLYISTSCGGAESTSILDTIHILSAKRDTINVSVFYNGSFNTNCNYLNNLITNTDASCTFYGGSYQGCDSIVKYKIQVLPIGVGCKPIIDTTLKPIHTCINTPIIINIVAHDSSAMANSNMQCQWQYFDNGQWQNLNSSFNNSNVNFNSNIYNGKNFYRCVIQNAELSMNNIPIRALIKSACGIFDSTASDTIHVHNISDTYINQSVSWDTTLQHLHITQEPGGVYITHYNSVFGCDSVLTNEINVIDRPASGPYVLPQVYNFNQQCAYANLTASFIAYNFINSSLQNYGLKIDWQFLVNNNWLSISKNVLDDFKNYGTITSACSLLNLYIPLRLINISTDDKTIVIDSLPLTANGIVMRVKIADNITDTNFYVYQNLDTINITGQVKHTYILDTVVAGTAGLPNYCYNNGTIQNNLITNCTYTTATGCDSIVTHFIQLQGEPSITNVVKSSSSYTNFTPCSSDTTIGILANGAPKGKNISAFISSYCMLGAINYTWQIDTSGNGQFVNCADVAVSNGFSNMQSAGSSLMNFYCDNKYNHHAIRCVQQVSNAYFNVTDSSFVNVVNFRSKSYTTLFDTIAFGSIYTLMGQSYTVKGTYSINVGNNIYGCDSSVELHLFVTNVPACALSYIFFNVSDTVGICETLTSNNASWHSYNAYVGVSNGFTTTSDSIKCNWQRYINGAWQNIIDGTSQQAEIIVNNTYYSNYTLNKPKDLYTSFSIRNMDATWNNLPLRIYLFSTCGGVDSSIQFSLQLATPSVVVVYDTIVYGQSFIKSSTYNYNSEVYKYNGVYHFNVGWPNANGCDSILQTHLFVIGQPSCYITDTYIESTSQVCANNASYYLNDSFVAHTIATMQNAGITNLDWYYTSDYINYYPVTNNIFGSRTQIISYVDSNNNNQTHSYLYIDSINNLAMSGLQFRCLVTTNCSDTAYSNHTALYITTLNNSVHIYDTIEYGNYIAYTAFDNDNNINNDITTTFFSSGLYAVLHNTNYTIFNSKYCARIDSVHLYVKPPVGDTTIVISNLPTIITGNANSYNYQSDFGLPNFNNKPDILYSIIAPTCADSIIFKLNNSNAIHFYLLDSNKNIITQSLNCYTYNCNDSLFYLIPNKGAQYYVLIENQYYDNTNDFTFHINLGIIPKDTITVAICNTGYMFKNVLLNNTGYYRDTLVTSNGCDSVYVLHLLQQAATKDTINVSACSAYNFNGQLISSTGFYSQIYNNNMGCDSIITLHAIIGTPTYGITNITINNNGPYTAPWGQVVLSTNTISHTYLNALGCDSVININVIIYNGIRVAPKVFLSGAFDISTGIMHDSLRQLGLIPLTQPYGTAPLNNFVHVNGNATQTIAPAVLAVTGNNAIVDWVFVQVRSGINNETVLATKAALLQRDGDVVDADGTSPLAFANLPPANYYVSIKHRNHAGIMGANAYALTGTPRLLDYTNTATVLYVRPGTLCNPMPLSGATRILVSTTGNIRAMYAGNCEISTLNTARIITYNNSVLSDRASMLNATGGVNIITGYSIFDLNLNGSVRFTGPLSDRAILLQNCLGSTSVIINEQTPN